MYEIAKRLMDICFSLLMLIALSPVLPIISLVIRVGSPGPIFFKTQRVGKNGRLFSALKFRTMRVNVDTKRYVVRLISGQFGPERGSPLLKLNSDPRFVRGGRFLRRTGLDEIPQLINVLQGDMSLVGPRAAIEYEVEHYEEWQKERLKVKPGLTGLSQISGKNRLTFNQESMLDVKYIKNRSFWFDLKILLKTFCFALFSDTAY